MIMRVSGLIILKPLSSETICHRNIDSDSERNGKQDHAQQTTHNLGPCSAPAEHPHDTTHHEGVDSQPDKGVNSDHRKQIGLADLWAIAPKESRAHPEKHWQEDTSPKQFIVPVSYSLVHLLSAFIDKSAIIFWRVSNLSGNPLQRECFLAPFASFVV
jgi:hypothetical protein